MASPMDDWRGIMDRFTALGGVVDNARPGVGPFGAGLFAIDPNQPVHLHTPPNLLFAAHDTVLEGSDLRLAPGALHGDAERAFFADYQAALSWGGGGRQDCLTFLAGLNALPAEPRDRLTVALNMAACPAPETLANAMARFEVSRVIRIEGVRVFMPIVELANHSAAGVGLSNANGVLAQGQFTDEVLLRYRRGDAALMLAGWGFASPEPLAYSLATLIPHASHVFSIRRGLTDGAPQDGLNLPSVKRPDEGAAGRVIVLSHLLLGHRKHPDRPRAIVRRLMDQLSLPGADAFLDEVRDRNRDALETLKRDLEGAPGGLAPTVRAMCDYQLEALAFCDRV